MIRTVVLKHGGEIQQGRSSSVAHTLGAFGEVLETFLRGWLTHTSPRLSKHTSLFLPIYMFYGHKQNKRLGIRSKCYLLFVPLIRLPLLSWVGNQVRIYAPQKRGAVLTTRPKQAT